MQSRERKDVNRHIRFFLICLSHESLVGFYKTNFQLMQHHHYSLTEIEMMMPWEREIYIAMLVDYLKEEKEKQEQQEMQSRRK